MFMTTEVNEPRDINILLALETYQGMTDEEIESIISYKVNAAVSDRELLARITAITQKSEQCIADNRASAQRALDMIESIVRTQLPTVPIGTPETVVPRSIGV